MKKLMTLIGLVLILTACSTQDAEKTPTDHLTVVLQPAMANGQYVVGSKLSQPSLTNHWPTGGYAFYSFIFQNGKFFFSGVQNSNERRITGDDETGNITVSVPVYDDVDLSIPYTVILADRSCSVEFKDNDVIFNTDLERGISHASAYYVASGRENETSPATASFLTATECVWFNNITNKSVKVKHKGFKAAGKWYCVKASMKAVGGNGVSIKPFLTSDEEETASQDITVKAKNKGYILSQFVPNGTKMTNASIVLEIDGKEYTSPAISSNTSFSNGEIYFYSLTWDGNTLNWLTD